MQANEALAEELDTRLTTLSWQERLNALASYPELNAAFSTSFSIEDQIITHAIAENHLHIRIFTLDTGRLFEETHQTHMKTRKRYGTAIETYYPDAITIQSFVEKQGINGFYDSVENRIACCHIRKVEPLARALLGTDIWISGLRREHSEARGILPFAAWDETYQLIKFYPLADMDINSVWAFAKEKNVPYNPLHDRGFPSIGCAPCTRAIHPGEHMRAGRWWWELEEKKECGLHMVNGKLVRNGNTPDA